MKVKRNEELFKDDLIVLDYLFYEYKTELKKTHSIYGSGEYKATSKSRLHRLRLEINNILKDIEDGLPSQYLAEVE